MIKPKPFFYLLFCASLALSGLYRTGDGGPGDRFGLWSDRAGYYIYLPALFQYGFDARRMPPDLDVRTGGGFSLDTVSGRIDTKYTYGVALMVAPFYLAAEATCLLTGTDPQHGFSAVHLRFLELAAVVFLVLGLWLLWQTLAAQFRPAVAWAVTLLIFLATNLYYYSVIEGMMSHVYSFFLFAWFLWSLRRFLALPGPARFLPVAASFALAVLVRPTALLLIVPLLAWDTGSLKDLTTRVNLLTRPAILAILAGLFLVLFLPQAAYWKYLSGHFLHFSYRGEGFLNWSHPRAAEVLFSPVNGLFVYTPLALFFVAGLIVMFVKRSANRWPVAILFLAVTLVCASWTMWYFGCSYGQRSYIEYYVFLSVPLGVLITAVAGSRSGLLKTAGWFLLLLFVYVNIRFVTAVYRYDRCWFGSTWDWHYFAGMYRKAGLLPPGDRTNSFANDFENLAILPVKKPAAAFSRSGRYSVMAGGEGSVALLYARPLQDFGYPPPKMVDAGVWYLPADRKGGTLQFVAVTGGKIVFRDALPLPAGNSPGTWLEATARFIVPDLSAPDAEIRLYLRSAGGELYSDDLRLTFRNRWD